MAKSPDPRSAPNHELRAAALAHYGELARLGKAFSSPLRLRVVDLLRQGPRSVESLAAETGASVANVSQHLQQLKVARVVVSEKDAQRAVYRLADPAVSGLFGAFRELAELVLPEMDRLRQTLAGLEASERAALLDRVVARRVLLLDVRPAGEFSSGHLPGAISVPLEELPARLADLPRSREVVAYCRGPYCSLAREAVELLTAAGFRARHLDVGAPDLAARGLTLEAGPPARPTPKRKKS